MDPNQENYKAEITNVSGAKSFLTKNGKTHIIKRVLAPRELNNHEKW